MDGCIVAILAAGLAVVLSLLRPDAALGVIVTGRTVEPSLNPDAAAGTSVVMA